MAFFEVRAALTDKTTLQGPNDARDSMELGSIATQDADDVAITGGTISALDDIEIGAFSDSGASNGKATTANTIIMESSRDTTVNSSHYRFFNPNGQVGNIQTSSSSTSFNTSSDERLKSDHRPFDPGPILDAVEVSDYRMGGVRQRGFSSAQQVHVVFPEAVTPGGPPGTWFMDYSKMVPVLWREVQRLRARVAALEGGQ